MGNKNKSFISEFRRVACQRGPCLLSIPLAGKRDIVVTILFGICACVRASVRICPDHNLYNNAWISKQFGIVVALEKEKCHLKHF